MRAGALPVLLLVACFSAFGVEPRHARVDFLRHLVSQALPTFNQFVHTSADCADGCELRGNCNRETGKCECPFPRRGTTCEIDQLAKCYDAPISSTPAFPSCGHWAPKNCECYKQCHNVYCHNATGPAGCEHEIGLKMGLARCFLHRNRPLHEQDSIIPRNGTADLDWYQVPQFIPQGWPDGQPREEDRLPKAMEFMVQGTREVWVLPLEDCPQGCTGRGACVQDPARIYCLCRKGFKGDSCEEEDDEGACWFSPKCGGHGKCRSGFCHCDKGWWGLDCSRSQAWVPAPGSRAVQSRTNLRIYMYDLPSTIVFPGEFSDGAYTRDPMYTSYEYFLKYFLQDWTVRTENPHEANLFFVPAMVYFYVAHVWTPVVHLRRVINYISTEFPYWNRTGGRDHFWWMTSDQGGCDLPREFMDKPIKIVHFGLSGPDVVAMKPHVDPQYGCLRPERDIVTPPIADNAFAREGKTAKLYEYILANQGRDNQTREMLFFFAGGIDMTNLVVSGGARQALYRVLQGKNFSDVLVVQGRVNNYEEMFLTSKFCIAPYGHGWGLRLAIAVVHGCIPVIIQDHVWQPFEELLPYAEFAVRIQVRDVPLLVELLRSYTPEQLDGMRLALAHHWAAFVWPQDQGGRAYNYTIQALRHRIHNFAAEYY